MDDYILLLRTLPRRSGEMPIMRYNSPCGIPRQQSDSWEIHIPDQYLCTGGVLSIRRVRPTPHMAKFQGSPGQSPWLLLISKRWETSRKSSFRLSLMLRVRIGEGFHRFTGGVSLRSKPEDDDAIDIKSPGGV